jgi:hypothetical protein
LKEARFTAGTQWPTNFNPTSKGAYLV